MTEEEEDVIMRPAARISADDSSTASSMHERIMSRIADNESINQERLQNFMGLRPSRPHASVQSRSCSDVTSSCLPLPTNKHPNDMSPEERDEMLATGRQVSLFKDEKQCALSKLSSSLACVACVAGGVPKEISHDMSDLTDHPIVVTRKRSSKQVTLLSDLVDESEEENEESSLKENEADELIEKIDSQIHKREVFGVSNERICSPRQRIEESVNKIREKIYGKGHNINLDEYSQHRALTFRESEMSQVNLVACLGFERLRLDDLWASESSDSSDCSSTNVPMGGTFTLNDTFKGSTFTFKDTFEDYDDLYEA